MNETQRLKKCDKMKVYIFMRYGHGKQAYAKTRMQYRTDYACMRNHRKRENKINV